MRIAEVHYRVEGEQAEKMASDLRYVCEQMCVSVYVYQKHIQNLFGTNCRSTSKLWRTRDTLAYNTAIYIVDTDVCIWVFMPTSTLCQSTHAYNVCSIFDIHIFFSCCCCQSVLARIHVSYGNQFSRYDDQIENPHYQPATSIFSISFMYMHILYRHTILYKYGYNINIYMQILDVWFSAKKYMPVWKILLPMISHFPWEQTYDILSFTRYLRLMFWIY